jgi:hypothetical protein
MPGVMTVWQHEQGGSRMGVNADALGGTMIHRDEYRRRPFTGEGGGKQHLQVAVPASADQKIGAR